MLNHVSPDVGVITHKYFMSGRLGHYFIIAFFVVIAYLPTFTGDFVYDDQALIGNNPYITKLQSLSSYMSQEDNGIVDPRDNGSIHTGYYRPLLNITYFIDYKLWGMKAYGFRATNLMMHLLACFLLYELLMKLIGYRSEIFWTVLLFAVHPIHTETVSIITSRNNILSTIFILASFYTYLIWWKKGTPCAMAASLLAFIGAVFSKEFGLMALPIFFLYQRIVSEEKNLRREMESYIPYLIILTVYFLLRKAALHTPLSIPDDILMRMAYIPYLIAYNLRLMFIPYELHSFFVEYPRSLLTPPVIGAFLLVLFSAIFLSVLRKESLVIFAVAAFIITLLPVLNLINSHSTSLIAMRWLYLPMSFLVFGFVPLLAKLRVDHRKTVKKVALMAATVYLAAGSYTLNAYLWHDQETFIKQEVIHFSNYLYMGDYAILMLKNKQYREAEYYFQKSLKNSRFLERKYINYGALLIDTGRPQEALYILEKARSLIMSHKSRCDWHNNMGLALTMVGNYEHAHDHFNHALALDPQNLCVNRNLAYLLLQEGRTEEATERLNIGKNIKPTP